MSVYASKRPVEQTHTHKYIPDTRTVLCTVLHIFYWNIQYARKTKAEEARFLLHKEKGAQTGVGASCHPLHSQPLCSMGLPRFTLHFFYSLLCCSSLEMNGCTYTFTVELWPAKKTHNKLKMPNMKALWVVSAFLLRHLRLKRLPRASEGSKGLDKALRWRWGWWRFIISMMEREQKHQLRDERHATWTRESLLGKEVPRDVNYGDGWFWIEDTTGFFAQQQQINK